MTTQAINWPGMLPLVSTPATSGTAKQVAEMLSAATRHERRRATDWRPVVQAAIEQLAAECSASSWDGYGAKPISGIAKQNAQHFVELLPADLPEPEAVPDPDGEVSLCWDFGPDHVFTISLAESGVVNYAGILGKGVKRHGQEPFRGDVAKILVESVRKIAPLG